VDEKSGQPKQTIGIDPTTGQQRMYNVLSPWGQRYGQYVKQIESKQQSRGYNDIEEQKELALTYVQRDYALWQIQQGQQTPAAPVAAAPAAPAAAPKTPQQLANDAFLNRANPPGKKPGAGAVNPAPVVVNKRNIAQVMREELLAAGMNDGTLRN
jgi:hypothetical protein